MSSTFAVACDHAGFDYKSMVLSTLQEHGFTIADFGCFTSESTDYPDFVHPAAQAVESGKADQAIVVCGSGNGVAMTANKYPGIRAAICWTPELAELARRHNDANVLAIPSRFVSESLAKEILEKFLLTEFEGGRHLRRVNKINRK